MRHLVLYSGGPDSFIGHAFVRDVMSRASGPDATVEPVYVPLAHRYQRQEEVAVMETLPDTRILRVLGGLGSLEEDDAYIPNRNAFLVLAASTLVQGKEMATIWLTAQKDEMSIPDRSMPFMASMGRLFTSLGQNIQVFTPFPDMDKVSMFQWYRSRRLDLDLLRATHSCYRPSELPCGNCPACIRRFIAMRAIGVSEDHEMDPKMSPCAAEYIERATKGEYSRERCNRILTAFGG